MAAVSRASPEPPPAPPPRGVAGTAADLGPPPAAGYRRVRWRGRGRRAASSPSADPPPSARDARIRWAVLPVSAALCAGQAILTVFAENLRSVYLTSTQIAVVAFGVVALLVLIVNPSLKLVTRGIPRAWPLPWPRRGFVGGLGWLRPLNRPETACLFAAMILTSGVSSFGLASTLVPLIASPWNPEWNTPQRGWEASLLPRLRPELYLAVPAEGTAAEREAARERALTFRRGATHALDGRRLAEPPQDAAWPAWARHYLDVAASVVPWGLWLPRLARWLLFVGAVYGLFVSLSFLVLPAWSRGEKLIFPLAKLAEALLPDERPAWHGVPRLFTRLTFWLGFAVSFGTLAWNAAIRTNWIAASLGEVPLGLPGGVFDVLVAGTSLAGLGGGTSFLIIYTAIGIAFLLPAEISFSVWGYTVLGLLMFLAAAWGGYGTDLRDFPNDWLWTHNFVAAQGGGALLLFGAASLGLTLRGRWKGRTRNPRSSQSPRRGHFSGHVLRTLDPAVAGLALSTGVMVLWLRWNRVPLVAAAGLVVFLTLFSLGFMRIVAQCGIYWFQASANFFHFYRLTGLGTLGSTLWVGPLVPILSVLFMDLKTFIAPNVLNVAKIGRDTAGMGRAHDADGRGHFSDHAERSGVEDDPDEPPSPHVRRERLKFHLNLVVSMAATVAAAVGLSITLAYARGGQRMNTWFYSEAPQRFFDLASRAMTQPAVPQPRTVAWYAVGAAWTALSLFARRSLFWFPHPVGYIMLINPLMRSLWFSFFLGWICKRLVVRYGGKAAFERTQDVFLGLIVGELLAIFVGALVGLALGFPVTLDLNRLVK